MHIPDGYLSPIFSAGAGVVTVPTWVVATRQVRKVLNNRTVPLLAVFAAFSFTIMLFNVPVPGGTTTHAVGGTLIAIVLGPAAAVIAVSAVLTMQALFFGDGGVTTLFANALNMAIILPLVGYGVYRLIAGKAPLLSARRIWAAGIGSYIGIMACSLAVGVEVGLQPLLFSQNGQPQYFPYPLSTSVPAMLIATGLSGGIAEALVTGLGLAFLQKNYPIYLTSLRRIVAGGDVAEGEPVRVPMWILVTAGVIVVAIFGGIVGIVSGGGDPTHAFGLDWATLNASDVGTTLLVILIAGVALIPLARLVAPKRAKGALTVLTSAAVLVPLGLLAPGDSFVDAGGADFKSALGYIPSGFQQLSTLFSAPLADYNLPFGFFSGSDTPLWHVALGYELSAFMGFLLVMPWLVGLATLVRRQQAAGVPVDDAAGNGPAQPALVTVDASPSSQSSPPLSSG